MSGWAAVARASVITPAVDRRRCGAGWVGWSCTSWCKRKKQKIVSFMPCWRTWARWAEWPVSDCGGGKYFSGVSVFPCTLRVAMGYQPGFGGVFATFFTQWAGMKTSMQMGAFRGAEGVRS